MYGKRKIKMIAKRHGVDIDFAKRYASMKEEYPRLTMWAFKLWNHHPRWEGKDIMEVIKHTRRDKGNNFVDDVESNGDFDNFFSRGSRRKLRKRLRRRRKKFGGMLRALRPDRALRNPKGALGAVVAAHRPPKSLIKLHSNIATGGVGGVLSQINRDRKIINKKHGRIIRSINNPMFMANPKNRIKLSRAVRGMAKRINRGQRRRMGWTKFFHKVKGLRGLGRMNPLRPPGRPMNPDLLRPTPSYRPYDRGGAVMSTGLPPRDYRVGVGRPVSADLISDSNFSNAAGGAKNFMKKNKWLVIGGAAAVVLFFTPFGKKLMKGKK